MLDFAQQFNMKLVREKNPTRIQDTQYYNSIIIFTQLNSKIECLYLYVLGTISNWKKQVPKTFFAHVTYFSGCFESCLELKLNNNSWKKLGSTLKWLLYTWLFNFQTEGPPTALWWKTEFSENLLIEKKNKLSFNVGFNWIFSMFTYLLITIYIILSFTNK